jgi:cell wall-associated NlpC family hydrolase
MKLISVHKLLLSVSTVLLLSARCINEPKGDNSRHTAPDATAEHVPAADTGVKQSGGEQIPRKQVSTDTVKKADTLPVSPDSLVAFARTLLGVPYRYASTDPAKGLDCSGFITCVFSHFKISVPRSSVNFTDYGKTITLKDARPGDLILFTGTDSTVRIVGHMGIVESIKKDTLYFIHSSSGKANGVVISPLGNYYRGRFVKTIRVFPDESVGNKQ